MESSVRCSGRRGNRKSRQREPRDPHSATARVLGSGFDRRRRSGEAGDVAGCLLASRLQTGMWRFFQLFQRQHSIETTAMAQETRSMAPSASGIDQPPTKGTAIRNVTIANRKAKESNSQGKRRPSTVDKRTTDDDEHEAWHHALGTRPIVAARPAATGSPPGEPGVYGMPLGRRGETCSGRIGLLGALFSNVTRGWCEDIATLPNKSAPVRSMQVQQSRASCPPGPCLACPAPMPGAGTFPAGWLRLLSSTARDEPLLFLSFPLGTGQARRPGPGPHNQAGSFHPRQNRLRIMLAHQHGDVTWPAVVGGYQPTCTNPTLLLGKRPYPAHAQVSRTGSPVSLT